MSNRNDSLALIKKKKHRAEVALRQAMFAVDQPGGKERVENLRKKIDAYTWVLAYIPQLEAELEKVKRERDALRHEVNSVGSCAVCGADGIKCRACYGASEFVWRGPCAENGGA